MEDLEAQIFTPHRDRLLRSRTWRDLIFIPSPKIPALGYRKVATAMALPHSKIPIFRKFGTLNLLNLLSLQAEVLKLQLEFGWMCEVDDHDERRRLAFSFEELMETDSNGEPLHQQWRIFRQLRGKLKEYSKTATNIVCVMMLSFNMVRKTILSYRLLKFSP